VDAAKVFCAVSVGVRCVAGLLAQTSHRRPKDYRNSNVVAQGVVGWRIAPLGKVGILGDDDVTRELIEILRTPVSLVSGQKIHRQIAGTAEPR